MGVVCNYYIYRKHRMPKFTLLCFCIIPALLLQAQQPATYDTTRKFAADTIIKSIKDITRELELKHPGFYRYHSKETFGQYIDSITGTITDSLNEQQTYRKLKPIISHIGCLHTGLNLARDHTNYLNTLPNLFPFQLYFKDQRAYIIKNFSSNSTIQPGAELLSINGRSMEQLLQTLLPAIPSDGYNMTMKYLALYHFFPTWYRSMIEITDRFQITVLQSGQQAAYTISSVKYGDIAQNGFLNEAVYPKQLEFSIDNNIGKLAIHSFAASDIKRSKQKFKPFIKDAFRQLRTGSIDHLVIDLRYNTGGSDANAAYFARHFFDRSFRYWDRIEVTPAIAKAIKGKYTLFYRKPVQRDSVWLWRKARIVKDFNFYSAQQPAKYHYTGNVYILINGFCMSSCADVAAVLAHNKKATFIGEETGGGYQGNTSGMMPETTIPPTRLRLSVPLQKYYNAVDPAVHKGRGTMPGHPVSLSVEECIQQKDVAMQLALDIINKKVAALP
jgi:hypothetical protein